MVTPRLTAVRRVNRNNLKAGVRTNSTMTDYQFLLGMAAGVLSLVVAQYAHKNPHVFTIVYAIVSNRCRVTFESLYDRILDPRKNIQFTIGDYRVHKITKYDFDSPTPHHGSNWHWKCVYDSWDLPPRDDPLVTSCYALELSHVEDIHPKRHWTQFITGPVKSHLPWPFNIRSPRIQRADIQSVTVEHTTTKDKTIHHDITDKVLDLEGHEMNNFGGAAVTLGNVLDYALDNDSLARAPRYLNAKFTVETLTHKHRFAHSTTLHEVDIALSQGVNEIGVFFGEKEEAEAEAEGEKEGEEEMAKKIQ